MIEDYEAVISAVQKGIKKAYEQRNSDEYHAARCTAEVIAIEMADYFQKRGMVFNREHFLLRAGGIV